MTNSLPFKEETRKKKTQLKLNPLNNTEVSQTSTEYSGVLHQILTTTTLNVYQRKIKDPKKSSMNSKNK